MQTLTMVLRKLPTTEGGRVVVCTIRLLPYVFAVVALKVVVVCLLLESFSGERRQTVAFDDYGVLVAPSAALQETDDRRQEKEEMGRVLSRLNDTVLMPSSRNRTPDDTIWLFFNRVPRTGGQTLVALLQSLGEDLDFQHQTHEYRTPWQRLLTDQEQNNLATWFEYNFWPKSYDRFSLFINFTQHRSKYTKTRPAYVTLLRDPVEKFISAFHFARLDVGRSRKEMALRDRRKPGDGRRWYWRTIDECVLENHSECALPAQKPDFLSAIPFLCGQSDQCLMRGNKWALQKAKYNLEFEYSVVGVLEEWNRTVTVLEHFLPLFFRGALSKYWSKEFPMKMEKKNRKRYKPPSDEAVQKLRDKLSLEIDLYEFAVQRLQRQYAALEDRLRSTTPLPRKAPTQTPLSALDRFQIELRHLDDS